MRSEGMIQGAEKLEVKTFVRLVLSYNEVQLNEEDIRSDMLTKLLVYFICNRNRTIAVQELVDALWVDEESDNPAGALKNLVYRLRVFLKKKWGGVEFVKTERGGYRWNSDMEVVLDAEEFEVLSKKASTQKNEEKKLSLLLEAIGKYEGMFMPKLSDEYWISTLKTYYHSMYLEAVKDAVVLLENEGDYGQIEEIVSDALLLDNLDENLHTYMVNALVKQEKFNLAKEQYEKAESLLYENLGVRPSVQLRESYEEIHKQLNVVEENIGVIQMDLDIEEDVEGGTFFCEYGVFRKAYQLEKRRMKRINSTSYVVLVSLEPRANIKRDSQAYLNMMQKGMDTMKRALLATLREGDVVARYSGVQYIMLISNCSGTALDKIEERIEKKYYKEDKFRKVELSFSVNEV